MTEPTFFENLKNNKKKHEELYDGVAYHYNDDLINKIHKKILNEQKSLDVPERLKKQWMEVNFIYKDIFLNDKIINLVKLSTGAGKTANIIQWILNIIRYTIDFMVEKERTAIVLLGQQYEQGVKEFERQIEKFAQVPLNYLIFEGKGRTCLRRIDPLVECAEKIGLSIDYLCRKCEHRDNMCPYFCKIRELFPPSYVSLCLTVSHQINKFIPIWLTRLDRMVLVIDEDFENAIKTNNKIYLSTLNKNITFLEKVIMDLELKKTSKTIFYLADFEMLLEFLNLLKEGIINELDYKKIKDILDCMEDCFDVDGESINILNTQAWKILEKNEKRNRQLENKNIRPNSFPFKRFYFYHILSFIRNYFYMKKTDPTNIDNWLEKVILRVKFKNKNPDDNTPQYRIGMLYYDFHSIVEMLDTEKIIKLIINDATASILKLQKIFGDRLQIYKKNMVSNNLTIYKLEYPHKRKGGFNRKFAYYPKASIQRYSTLKRLKEDMEAYIYAFPEIGQHLFVSRDMKVRTKPSDEQPNTRLWKYIKKTNDNLTCVRYPLAGTNEYENFNSTILFGTPDIPSGHINRESTFFSINPDEYREEKAQTEMSQAMGRMMRGINDKFCLELSGLDLGYNNVENVKVITFRNHRELQSYFKEIGDKKRGITKELDKRLKDFLTEHHQITIDDCMELYNISYYIAKKKLDNYVRNKNLKIKTIIPSKKGGKPKSIYYL
ncbi:MAG: hypothetical protein ACFFCV_15855 [Promethearchaeota archaeon]